MYSINLPTNPSKGGIPARDNSNNKVMMNSEWNSCRYFNLFKVE
jgi:hypothetical protein